MKPNVGAVATVLLKAKSADSMVRWIAAVVAKFEL